MTNRRVHVLSMIAITGIAFFYQLTAPSFGNDHFDHLSKARQVLHGEYPVRDFFDPGRPLTIGVSAVALSLSHDTLFGEAMLTMGAIAVGVMLVYWLTRRFTGSTLWSYWAAGCTLAIEPRLYNYPKVLVCTVALWLIVRYLDAPSAPRAACLGAWGGVGFLFRHDLGVYLAIVTITALLSRRSRDAAHPLRAVAIVGITAAMVAAPYFVYLAQVGALATVAEEGGEGLVSAARVTWRPFVGPSSADPAWLRYDAENWLYYLFLFSPLVAIGARLSGRVASSLADHVVALAMLCAALMLFLIRGNLDSRLPDVAAPSFVLTAWLLATLFESVGERQQRWRWIAATAVLAVGTITILSVQQLSEWQSARRVVRAIVRLPASLTGPVALLQADPLDAWEREGTTDVRGLARWMRSCTAPDDRFLVFGYHPEVFFHARRLFGGGMLFFHAGYFSSPADQRQTVERLRHQTAPFVVVEESVMPALDGTYAIVGAYVREHYKRVAETTFNGPRSFVIFQNNTSAARLSSTGLPCLF